MSVNPLPECGYLRLNQIIGQKEVTLEEAVRNKEKASALSEHDRRKDHSPKTPRKKITPLIPISRSSWWAGIRSGRFPKPIKLGKRTTVWRVRDIRTIIEQGTK
jgi:predicted DNA-binding transcriptional regulator AlpA